MAAILFWQVPFVFPCLETMYLVMLICMYTYVRVDYSNIFTVALIVQPGDVKQQRCDTTFLKIS